MLPAPGLVGLTSALEIFEFVGGRHVHLRSGRTFRPVDQCAIEASCTAR